MISMAVVSLVLSCGVERWDVKTLADPGAEKLFHPESFSGAEVGTLIDLPAPPWGDHAPRDKSERIIYEVEALLIGAKLEDDDRDLHIVIADPKDTTKTMIVEIPHPSCMEGAPQWAIDGVTKARAKYLSLMRVSAKFKKFERSIRATLRGLAFYDKKHGQTGVAPNGIELHPLFKLDVHP